MTTELTLVSRRAPTMTDLRAAVAGTGDSAGLGAAELVGDFDDGDPMVEISAAVSDGELLLQVFRPTVSLSTAADPYTVALGFAAPLGADGHCRLTAMAMSGTASDAQVRAVLALARHLALACSGYVVVNGEYLSLDGVPDPERIEKPPPARSEAPASRAFVEAFLTRTGDGEAGWVDMMGLLRTVLTDLPELRPRLIQREQEWRPFLPTDPVPEWWPLSQYLLTPQPYLRWEVNPAFGPADHYTQLSLAGDLAPEQAERLLPTLVALAGEDLDYGFVHGWHEDEPAGPTGLRRGPDGPWMLLTPRDLTEYLPNLYWAQVLGPPWVQLFGAETLATAPGYRVEEVAPQHWLVQLTEHLADVGTDHGRFEAVRAEVKRHLGADAFYSAERGHRARYAAPSIATLAERGLA